MPPLPPRTQRRIRIISPPGAAPGTMSFVPSPEHVDVGVDGDVDLEFRPSRPVPARKGSSRAAGGATSHAGGSGDTDAHQPTQAATEQTQPLEVDPRDDSEPNRDDTFQQWHTISAKYPSVQLASRLLMEPRTRSERKQCGSGRARPSLWPRLPLRIRQVLNLLDDRPGGRQFIAPYSAHEHEIVRIMPSVVVLDSIKPPATQVQAARNYRLNVPQVGMPEISFDELGREADSGTHESGTEGLDGHSSASASRVEAHEVPFGLPQHRSYLVNDCDGCLHAPEGDDASEERKASTGEQGLWIRFRLIGIKEDGDPNVPGGRISFVANIGEMWLNMSGESTKSGSAPKK